MAVTFQLMSDECCDFSCERCIQGSIPSTLTALLELSEFNIVLFGDVQLSLSCFLYTGFH